MWERLFDHIMRGFVRVGRVDVQLADGTTRTYSGADGPSVSLRFHDPDLPRKLVLTTDMALGEGYMDGRLTIGDDDLRGFLTFLTVNVERSGHLWWRRSSQAARRARRRFDQWNPAYRARQNVAHHYDLSATLYDLFLDEDRQYSCAYFRQPEMSLEEAQAAKKAHIAKKLLLEPPSAPRPRGCRTR